MNLRITISKYHSWYLCQISLQIMLLPIQIQSQNNNSGDHNWWKKPSKSKVVLALSAGKCTGTSQECCGFYFVECLTKWEMFCQNSPRSIYLNSNVTPRLSGHYSIISLVFFVLKSLLGIARHWSLEKFAILFLKHRSHDRILIYRTWAKQQKEIIFLQTQKTMTWW